MPRRLCILILGTAIAFATNTHAQPFLPNQTPAIVENFAAALAEDYAYEDVGRKMADALRARLAGGEFTRIATGPELAKALQETVRAINDDRHLNVRYVPPDNNTAPAIMGPPPKTGNGAIPRVEILEGNIGYIEVNGVPGLALARETIAAAFAFVRNTDALIIDARRNGGGSPDTVAFYVSYLSEGAPVVENRIHWRKRGLQEFSTEDLGKLAYGSKRPVFYLTSRHTFSGGEGLGYTLQASKRAILVGETTGGGANPGGIESLAPGFSAFIPAGYVEHPVTGKNWEGTGVIPDLAVPPEQAVTAAQKLAVAALIQDAPQGRDRLALETLRLSLETRRHGRNALTSAQIEGAYQVLGGPKIVVAKKDGALAIDFGPWSGLPLTPVGGDVYRWAGGPDNFTASFVRPETGPTRILVSPGQWLGLVGERS